MSLLKDKIILITGAGSGIGRATALLLAKDGAKIAVNDLHKEKAENVVQEIGSQAIAVQTDVTKKEEVEKMIKEIKEKLGPVDILINNATAPIDFKRFEDLGWEEFEKHFEVQAHGAFNTIKAVLPDMKERKSGNILNIITEAAEGVAPSQFSGYTTAKYGLKGLTRSLMTELRTNKIRVDFYSPPLTETDLTKNLPEIYKKQAAAPQDVARNIKQVVEHALGAGIEDLGYPY